MLLKGNLENEDFQFHVELFADTDDNLTFLIRLTENTYMLAQRNFITRQWLQISGSYIKHQILEAVFKAIDNTDSTELNKEIKPLRELKKSFLR